MKLSNLFNDCVRVAQGLRKGSARSAREWLKSMTVFLLLFTFAVGQMRGATTYTYRLVVSKSALVDGKRYILLSNDRTKAYNNGVSSNSHLTTTSAIFTSSSTTAGSAVTTTTAASSIKYITLIRISGDKYKMYDSDGKYITATEASTKHFSRANSDDNGWTFYGSTALDAIYEKAYSSKYACCRYYSNNSDFRSYQAAGHTSPSSNGASFYLATGCSVTYNANGATSGTVPTDSYLYGEGGTVTVKSNSGSLAKTVGYTFGGWNTKADGSGTNFTAGSGTFTISQDTILYAKWVSSCANTVTINKGASTNCSFSLDKSGAQASCDGVVTTISITPYTGYGTPEVSESGASSTPTKGGSGNSQTLTYAANTTGTSTIAVSCSANNYTINLDQDLTPTSAGTPSITATYNSNSNLTSAITPPTKTGWTFAGYFTAKNGGGTQIIDASGNVIASVSGYTDASKNWKYAGNITLYAKWTCTVTWSVNNLTNVYSAQTLTYNGSSTKVASIPGPPSTATYCGDKFVGWTTESNVSQDDDDGLGLFTTVAGSPELKTVGNTTFYAVFADYDE